MSPRKRRDSPQHGDSIDDDDPGSEDSGQTIRPYSPRSGNIDERLHLEHWLDQLTIATAVPHTIHTLDRGSCSIPKAWRMMLNPERRDRLLRYPDLLQRYIVQESAIQKLMQARIYSLEPLAKGYPEDFRRSMSADGHAQHSDQPRVMQELEHLRRLLDRRTVLSGVGYAEALTDQLLERKMSQPTSTLTDLPISMCETASEQPELRLKLDRLQHFERKGLPQPSGDLTVMMAGQDDQRERGRIRGQTEYNGRIYYGDTTEDEMSPPGPSNRRRRHSRGAIENIQRQPAAPVASPALSNDPMDANNNVGDLRAITIPLLLAPRSATDSEIIIQSRFATPEDVPLPNPFVTPGPRPVIDTAARDRWIDDMRRNTEDLRVIMQMWRDNATWTVIFARVAAYVDSDIAWARRLGVLLAQWCDDIASRDNSFTDIGV